MNWFFTSAGNPFVWVARCFRYGAAFLAALLGVRFLTSLRAEDTSVPASAASSEHIGPIQLQEVPVAQVLDMLERWTGKSILRPQTLPAIIVSLNLKEEVTKAQAIRALETLLSLNGIGVTALDENFLKVVPLTNTKAEAPELITGSTLDLPPSGQTASKLFRPQYLRVGDFMPQVASFLNPAIGSPPAVFEKANTALITDSISNLQRVETILAQIDRPEMSRLQPKFYDLKFAKASEVVGKIHGMFAGALLTDLGSASYSADDRTNQIVLFADAQQHPVFDQLIAKLDVKSGQDTLNDIIYLQHAAAKDVASILTQLVSGQSGPNRSSSQDANKTNVTAGQQTGVSTASVGLQAAPPDGSQPVVAGVALTPTNQFSALLTVLPEDRSNSIVVSGTADDIRLIHALVAKIDILLAQVRIEVVIAEVSLDNNDTTGISALGLQISGDKLVGFSGSLPGLDVANGTVTRPDSGAKTPSIITGPWDLAAQITLGTTPRKTNTNILSVPNIITTHNREGKIFVGQEVPVISGYLNTGTGAGGGSNGGVGSGYLSTVNSKDIGIQLTVKPLIGADGSVQLEIKQDVNDILGNVTIDGNSQPIIGRRSTESFVSARSGEVIVLGGLQRSSQSLNTSRLGPIPLIGDLFGTRTKQKSRTDLVFFLRPTVLANSTLDNRNALQEVDQFPKSQRKDIKKLLEPAIVPMK